MSSAMFTALSGLRALTAKMDVSANNVANLETEGFKKSRALLQEARPAGVIVTIESDPRPGTMVLDPFAEGGTRELSNVNLHEEFASQLVTRYAYEAGTITVRTADEMEQTLMDILA